MPIEIYTGKPGNAKTAFLVDRILTDREWNEGNPDKARHLVAAGINGLVPGIADEILDDPTKWSEIIDYTQGDCTCPLIGGAPPFKAHTHRIRKGSLIYVDEAWKWFGHLHDARNRDTPRHVLDLAEHRHMGIDFVWTSQGPNQLFPFVRPLIADHTHHVRRFGTHFVDTFKWEELQEDVKSEAKRAASIRAVKVIPKRTFGLYKSAEVHTIKRSIPWRIWALPGLLLIAVLCAWLAYTHLRPSAFAKKTEAKEPVSAQAEPGSAIPVAHTSGEEKHTLTLDEYTALHTPRFATMPHTMPLFDDRAPVSDPQLFCMSTKAGLDGNGDYDNVISCTCLTEQGTKYEIDEGICMRVARWGQPYNPYKQPAQQVSNQWQSQPVVPSPPVTAASGTSQPFGTVTRYGRDGLGAY